MQNPNNIYKSMGDGQQEEGGDGLASVIDSDYVLNFLNDR